MMHGGFRGKTQFVHVLLLSLSFAWIFTAQPCLAKQEGAAAFAINKAQGRAMTIRLSKPMVVYETDWFEIIASKSYEKELVEKIGPNLVDLEDEFRHIFAISKDAPVMWAKGGKARIALLKSRKAFHNYIEVFEEEAEPERLSPGFADSLGSAQSFYWIEPLPYVVCCGEGASLTDLSQHMYHLLGHVLLTWHEYNYKFTPPWLHEGFGAYMAVRYGGGNILYCTQGLNNAIFGTGVFSGLTAWARAENWPDFFRQKNTRRKAVSMDVLNRVPIEEYEHHDAAKAWSFVSFLLDQHPEEFRTFVTGLKKQPRDMEPDSEWPPTTFAANCFRIAFGKTLEEMEAPWVEWAEAEREAEPMAKSGKAAKPGQNIKFDPNHHLEGFGELEQGGPDPAMDPYTRRTGDWMSDKELTAIQEEWDSTRKALLEQRAEEQEERLAHTLQGMDRHLYQLTRTAPYFKEEEIAGLISLEAGPEVFRSVVRFLAREHGCHGAFSRVAEALGEDREAFMESGLAEELTLLQEAAELERSTLEALAKESASFKLDFWPEKVKLQELRYDRLVVVAKKGKGEKPALRPGLADCLLIDADKEVVIHCPVIHMEMKTQIILCKNILERKDDGDRIGYLKMLLFRGDGAAMRKEARSIKSMEDETARLTGLAAGYEDGDPGADLLELAVGRYLGATESMKDDLAALIRGAAESPMADQLGRRFDAVVERILIEDYLSENRFLRSWKGFTGVDGATGLARFLYPFDDPAELDDFDLEPPPLARHLQSRYQVEIDFKAEPFLVEKGSLTAFGLAFITCKPVFKGATELKIRFKSPEKNKDASQDFYYMIVGYGLDAKGGYLASSCLTHVETQDYEGGKFRLLKAFSGDRMLEDNKMNTIHLKGTDQETVHDFNESDKWSIPLDGTRTGQVFLWVFGPRWFRIDELEISAAIDPEWLWTAVGERVKDDMAGIL